MSTFVIKNKVFEAGQLSPGLYLASTPIGNLGDITLRVLDALAAADLIACEDTRVTGKLLRHFSIDTPMTPYHEHNAETAGEKLIEKLVSGKSIVLASDAGTPLVSDPGYRLVSEAKKAGIPVIPLPGASAPLAALPASGIPTQQWSFHGFLPNKAGARKKRLQSLTSRTETLIFFESPNRLASALSDLADVFGKERIVCVARELTKLHEDVITAPLSELVKRYTDKAVKGEIVLIVSPAENEQSQDPTELISELLKNMTVKEAAAEAFELTGLPKRELYQLALSLKDGVMNQSISTKRIKAERLGKRAEWIAAVALMLKGYRIVARRFKTGLGEIDLIAAKGDVISFVEVKARPSVSQAVDAVTFEAQKRIENAADLWLSRQANSSRLSLRFDIVAVCPWQWPVHLKDAF